MWQLFCPRDHLWSFRGSIRERGVCVSSVESQSWRSTFQPYFPRTLYLFTQRRASFGHSPVSRCLLYRKECRMTLIRRNANALPPRCCRWRRVRATTHREFRRIFWYLMLKNSANVINARPTRRLKFLGKLRPIPLDRCEANFCLLIKVVWQRKSGQVRESLSMFLRRNGCQVVKNLTLFAYFFEGQFLFSLILRKFSHGNEQFEVNFE